MQLSGGSEKLTDRLDELSALYVLTDRLYRAKTSHEAFEAGLDAIRDGLGCHRASMLLFDDAGTMRFVAWRGLSERYRKALEGHSPWVVGERNADAIFVSHIAETDEAPAVKEIIADEGIIGLAFIPLTVQGEVVGKFMTYYEHRHSFVSHEIDLATTIARQIGFYLERTRAEEARRVAEEELRGSEQQFRLMSEHAPVMIWTCDALGKCTNLNIMLREFWGVETEDIPTFNWHPTIHPDDAADIGARMTQALATQSGVTVQGRYRNCKGEYRVLLTTACPHFSPSGVFRGLIGVNVDVTQRELLMAELNHRVKNTLAVVQGIANQTFRGTSATDAHAAFEGRLMALSAAHNILTQTNWEHASLDQLVCNSLQIRGAFSNRVSTTGPAILLQPNQALSLALAFHELLTNAVKYGALSNEAGKISVEWFRIAEPKPRLKLVWSELGGPTVSSPARRGFGSRLLERGLAADLEAEVAMDFQPQGLVCRIDAPLAEGSLPQ